MFSTAIGLLLRRRLAVRISVVGVVVRRHFHGGSVLQRVEVKRRAGMVHNRCFVLGPARVGKPAISPFLIGERHGVCNGALLHVEVRDVKRASGVFVQEPLLILETNPFLARRDTDTIQQPLRRQFALYPFEARLPVGIGRHQIVAPALLRVCRLHKNSAVFEAGVRPRVVAFVGQRDLLTGFIAHLARHHVEAARLRVLPVPDGRVGSVTSPGLIEIRVRAVGQFVEARTVNIDNTYRGFPIGHDRIILQSAEEDEHVAGLRPGRFEVRVPGCERLTFRRAESVDVDFAVNEIRSLKGGRRRRGRR